MLRPAEDPAAGTSREAGPDYRVCMDLELQADQEKRSLEGSAYSEARERADDFRRDALEDPAAAIYPHADVSDVELAAAIDGIVQKPVVITRQGAEAAVLVSVDFFNRAHAAVELLEDDEPAEAEEAVAAG